MSAPHARIGLRLTTIDMAGWRRVLWAAWRGIHSDSLLIVGRGIAFSAVMALVPTLIAFVSLYGLIADARSARDNLAFLSGVLPQAAITLIGDEMVRIATDKESSLSYTFFVSIGAALWTAIAGMKAMFRGLNFAYCLPERRSGLQLTLLAGALTLCAYGLLFATTVAMVVLPLITRAVPAFETWLPFAWLRWPALFMVVVVASETLYRVGPCRPLQRRGRLSLGSWLTAVVWITGSAVFTWYVSAFELFRATYGSLGAIFAVLIWSWLTAVVILVGGKLNCEIERELGQVQSP